MGEMDRVPRLTRSQSGNDDDDEEAAPNFGKKFCQASAGRAPNRYKTIAVAAVNWNFILVHNNALSLINLKRIKLAELTFALM